MLDTLPNHALPALRKITASLKPLKFPPSLCASLLVCISISAQINNCSKIADLKDINHI